jgi:tetratricopeptide (TPR) repeat protein
MTRRRPWPLLLSLCLGCTSLVPLPNDEEGGPELWAQGQAAMCQGQPGEAVRCYERSLEAEPDRVENHLSLAAALLEKGDPAAASPHLARYVAARPENGAVRSYYAELLLRLNQPAAARAEYEQVDAGADPDDEALVPQMIHCHRRLMELAEVAEDAYSLHLHRGIGLYLLARERAALPDPDGDLPTEGLLCKAAGELAEAQACRPEEARPSWYLYAVWSRLGQHGSAARCLRDADAAAPFAFLNPAEQRDLQLAFRNQAMARSRF